MQALEWYVEWAIKYGFDPTKLYTPGKSQAWLEYACDLLAVGRGDLLRKEYSLGRLYAFVLCIRRNRPTEPIESLDVSDSEAKRYVDCGQTY